MYIYMLFSLFLMFMFTFLNNPLSMGLILILQTLLLSFFFSSMMKFTWFLYLLILVFVGGMLVLFIYSTSIFPSKKFSFDQSTLFIFILTILSMCIFVYVWKMFMYMNLNMNNFDLLFNKSNNFYMTQTMKIFSSKNNLIFLFLVNYLFYCMIIVIKITNYYKMGPLRMLN